MKKIIQKEVYNFTCDYCSKDLDLGRITLSSRLYGEESDELDFCSVGCLVKYSTRKGDWWKSGWAGYRWWLGMDGEHFFDLVQIFKKLGGS